MTPEVAAALEEVGFTADPDLRDQLDTDAGEHPEYEVLNADGHTPSGRRLTADHPDFQALTDQGQPMQVIRGGSGMRATGRYDILAAYRHPADATVVVERNESRGVLWPPVAVIGRPDGTRVACDPDDTGLLAAEAARATGDETVYERRNLEFALRSIGFQADGDGGFIGRGLRITLGLLLLTLPTFAVRLLLPLLVALRPAMPLVDAYKKKVIDALYGNTAVGPPATVYTALSSTTPTQTGTNVTEPSGNGYARVAKTNDTTNFPGATTANPSVKANGTAMTFPAATGAGWGAALTHWVEYDALTVGNPLDWAALTASQTVTAGTTVSFAVGQWISQVSG